MTQPIFIIGEKGSGKTTFAKKLINSNSELISFSWFLENIDDWFLKFNNNQQIFIEEAYYCPLLLYLLGYASGYPTVQLIFLCNNKIELKTDDGITPLYFNLSIEK